jgi:hypothetical protein
MTTLDQTRLGLAARIETLNTPTHQVEVHGLVPGTVNPPAAIIGSPTIEEYRGDTDGVLDATWRIALVASTADPSQQLHLYPMLERSGPSSIFAAIEGDRDLGGLNVDAIVLSAQPFGQQEIGGTKYYVATVSVRTIIGQ